MRLAFDARKSHSRVDVERLLRSDGKVQQVAERVEFDCVVSLYWSSGLYNVAVMVVECAGQEGRIGGSQVRGSLDGSPPSSRGTG